MLDHYVEQLVGQHEGTAWAKLSASWRELYLVATGQSGICHIVASAYDARFAARTDESLRAFTIAFHDAVDRYWWQLYRQFTGPSPLDGRNIPFFGSDVEPDLSGENDLHRSRRFVRREMRKMQERNGVFNQEQRDNAA